LKTKIFIVYKLISFIILKKEPLEMSEEVLVVNNNYLSPYINNSGSSFIADDKERLFDLILEKHIFMSRDHAEYDFEHKQVIPYLIIRKGDNYLLLQRTTKQTEKRLHNKFSLGIGGHINPDSSGHGDNLIIGGLYKELNEEVLINSPSDLTFIGTINDESNSVSKVHLGLLYELEVLSDEYEVLEKDKMSAQWENRNNLLQYYDSLETWSQIVCDYHIIPEHKQLKATYTNKS
jgi:predicted NUDIX family phosphoesterase